MNIDEKLTDYFQEKRKSLQPPEHLRRQVLNKINDYDGSSKIKKRLIACCLAIFFLIPTGAISYTAYLADELYGSIENVMNHFSQATADSYVLLQAKLLQAKGELSKDDFQTLMDQLKIIVSIKMDYGDAYGNIDFSAIPDEKVSKYKEALSLAQPYFDRLNGHEPMKEHLSALQYEKYIESLMQYETILVQSGINPSEPFTEDEIKIELREQFMETKNTIEEYEQSVMNTGPHLPSPTFYLNGEEVHVEYGLPVTSKGYIDYRAFTHVLNPITIQATDDFHIDFVESVENVTYYAVDAEGKHPLTEFAIPKQPGQYTFAIEVKHSGEVTPYVFVVQVK